MKIPKDIKGQVGTFYKQLPFSSPLAIHVLKMLFYSYTALLSCMKVDILFLYSLLIQLTIRQKSSNVDNARPSKKMLQFKITDKNVSFFPAGTSSAVLWMSAFTTYNLDHVEAVRCTACIGDKEGSTACMHVLSKGICAELCFWFQHDLQLASL